MTSLKKWKKLAVTALFLAAFCAYVGNDFALVNVAQTAAVTALGVDAVEGGYEISAQIALPKGDATAPGSEQKVVCAKAKTVSGALALLGKTTGWYLKTSFCEVVVLSEGVVSTDVEPLLTTFLKDPRLQDAAYLVACKGSAKTLLSDAALTDDVSAFALGKTLQFSMRSPGGANAVTIKEFLLSLREKGQSAHMPLLIPLAAEEAKTEGWGGNGGEMGKKQGGKDSGDEKEKKDKSGGEKGEKSAGGGENSQGNGGEKKSEPSGENPQGQAEEKPKQMTYDASSTLLFFRGAAVAQLDEKSSLPYALITSKKSALLPISVQEGSPPDCLLAVTQNGSKTALKKEKNGFVFYVQLRLTAKVEDGFGITDLRPTDRKNYLPQAVKLAAERDLTAWTNAALDAAAEANCDFFGMKERLYRRYPKDYAAVGEGLLKNITYRVTVTVSPLR